MTHTRLSWNKTGIGEAMARQFVMAQGVRAATFATDGGAALLDSDKRMRLIKNHRVEVNHPTDAEMNVVRPDAAIESAENEGWPPKPA